MANQEEEKKALGLYVVLARDAMDFVDMLPEESDETLQFLWNMLTLPNPKHSEDTKELNSIGADMVAGVLRSRGKEPEKYDSSTSN